MTSLLDKEINEENDNEEWEFIKLTHNQKIAKYKKKYQQEKNKRKLIQEKYEIEKKDFQQIKEEYEKKILNLQEDLTINSSNSSFISNSDSVYSSIMSSISTSLSSPSNTTDTNLINNYDKLKNINTLLAITQMEQLMSTNPPENKKRIEIRDNQKKIAKDVLISFHKKEVVNVMVISETQSGKTGSMFYTIYKLLLQKDNLIPTENIFIITSLSSIEWITQTKERMPDILKENIIHRNGLIDNFVNKIINKKNIFIIIDEIHFGCSKHQTLFIAFQNAGLFNKTKLIENNINILEYSATPDGTLYNLLEWDNSKNIIFAEPGQFYKSSYDLLNEKSVIDGEMRIRQYKPLVSSTFKKNINIKTEEIEKHYNELNKEILNNILEIKNIINKYKNPLYHIIRTKTGFEQEKTILNFKKIFGKETVKYKKFDSGNNCNNTDINVILNKAPKKHTFIFIKDLLRCSKTIEKKTYIGILYERYSKNPFDSTIIQALIGRNTGYNVNDESICFTNIESIIKYKNLYNAYKNNYIEKIEKINDIEMNNLEINNNEIKNNDEMIQVKNKKWKSKTTTYNGNIIIGKNTINNIQYFKNNNENFIDEKITKKRQAQTTIFDTFKEAKNFIKNYFIENKGKNINGPKSKIPDENGFYYMIVRSQKIIYSINDIYRDSKFGLNENNYRIYPCYEKLENGEYNVNSLKWVLVYF